MVEYIDSYFFEKYKNVEVVDNVIINIESFVWGIDCLFIFVLKIYYMNEEVNRIDVSFEYFNICKVKLNVLLE